MKVGKFVVEILKTSSLKNTKKRNDAFGPYGKYVEKVDIPYIDDGNYHHKFDVMYGKEPRKRICIIDIHGGSYIFGNHVDQYIFGDVFLKQGYDFLSMDYIPNDGTRDTKDIFDDLYHCFKYVFSHLKELDLQDDDFVITGDSAGGHMALTMCELLLDKNYAKELTYELPNITPLACLVNCTVYDFVNITDSLSKTGQKRMFGPHYDDKDSFALLCPKTHIKSLTCPVFISTCSKDFLREQSLMLDEDLKEKGVFHQLVDIKSKGKNIGHVHNVIFPNEKESIEVNNLMMEFIDKVRDNKNRSN